MDDRPLTLINPHEFVSYKRLKLPVLRTVPAFAGKQPRLREDRSSMDSVTSQKPDSKQRLQFSLANIRGIVL